MAFKKDFILFARILCVFCVLMSTQIGAAGFQFYELATPSIGTASVGQAAFANDASTAYFNPAGMGKLKCSQLLLGTQLANSQTQFAANDITRFSGGSGIPTNLILPSAGIYYVASEEMHPLKFGFSLTSPYGGTILYGDGWAGRYFVQNIALLTLNFNPVIAYEINECLSIGGGFSLQYAKLVETLAFPLGDGIDGQADFRVHTTSPGFNLGLLYSPWEETRFGIAYRSQITQNMKGRLSFLRLTTSPRTRIELLTPQTVIMSLYQKIGCSLALTAEVGWANWKAFKNTLIFIDGFTLVVPREWRNTYRVGLGGEYYLNDCWTWQLGVSYDSAAVKIQHRLPDLPVDRQIRYGTGLIYTTTQGTRLGFQYGFLDLGKAPLDIQTRIGRLSGNYAKNFAHVFTMNVNFGL